VGLKRRILVAVCVIPLTAGIANAQVVIHAGPPPAVIVERPGPPLHTGWVWVPGYYRWSGTRYIWAPGRWVNPPRRGVVWIPGRWVPRSGGYVYIAGSWR
jgi:WXXGXW repeat (2 copies)